MVRASQVCARKKAASKSSSARVEGVGGAIKIGPC